MTSPYKGYWKLPDFQQLEDSAVEQYRRQIVSEAGSRVADRVDEMFITRLTATQLERIRRIVNTEYLKRNPTKENT